MDFRERFLRRTFTKTKSAGEKDFSLILYDVLSLLDKQKGKCSLTGWPMEFTHGGPFKRRLNPRGCTIDRIDNAKGYHKDNIQLVCCSVNITRSSLSLPEFTELCTAVASAQK